MERWPNIESFRQKAKFRNSFFQYLYYAEHIVTRWHFP